MGVRILRDNKEEISCLYCSTSGNAFGPIFYCDEEIEEFLKWLKIDPRKLSDKELEDKVYEWRKLND